MTDYKLVPVVPTIEMIAALGFGGDVELAIGHAAISDDIERAYKAMIAAAPAVQGEPVAEEVTLFECVSCNHLYQGQVTQCDCMPDEQKFNRWLARPERAVQRDEVAHTFYVLHDAAEGQEYIKKDIDDGCLAIFETEEDAQRAKRRHPGTEYKRVDYYTAPQPAEQQPAPDVADYEQVLDDHRRLTRELDVLLNGVEGAAQQASLADLVAQLRTVVRNAGMPVLAALDVTQLVEALEEIVKQYPNPNISHENFRVHACRHAESALAAYRKGG